MNRGKSGGGGKTQDELLLTGRTVYELNPEQPEAAAGADSRCCNPKR